VPQTVLRSLLATHAGSNANSRSADYDRSAIKIPKNVLFFSTAVFFGNPATLMLGQDATPQAIADLSHQMGFDRPVVVQYLTWVGHALTGDLGRSYTTHQTVSEMMIRSLPVTVELAVLSILLATVVSVGLNSLTWGQRAMRTHGVAIRGMGTDIRGERARSLRARVAGVPAQTRTSQDFVPRLTR